VFIQNELFAKAKLFVAKQYLLANLFVIAATLINYVIEPFMGYWGLGLIYLLALVVQSLFTSRGPIFLSAILGTCLWNFLFIPPKYTFRIHSPDDILLVVVYFVVAMVTGTLSATISKSKVLEESERLHKLLLSSLSHELRTPIAAIKGAVSNLQVESLIANQTLRTQVISEIQVANERLNRLIENLLDMSRLESGYLKPRLEWCDVADLISTTIRQFKDKSHLTKITVNIDADLPLVNIDFVLMEQVLSNLLHNAVSHSPESSQIRISCKKIEKTIQISVSDNGPGIEQNILPHIFEKFVRAPKAASGGIGLGLAIAKGFVEIQGGFIEVKNLPQTGACFTVKLPVKEVPHVPRESSQ